MTQRRITVAIALEHARADHKCGRNWNNNGCACGGCRQARDWGLSYRVRSDRMEKTSAEKLPPDDAALIDFRSQLNELTKAAKKYKRCAEVLLNAQTSLAKHTGGVPAHSKAVDRYNKADAAYELAAAELDRLTGKDQKASQD